MFALLNVGTLGRVLARTRDRQSIFHMAAVVLTTNVVTQGLFIVGSILLVRHISKADYGLWRVLASLIAFTQLLFVGFDHAITRFVPVESRRDADAVVWSAFALKAALAAVVLVALVASLPALPRWLDIPPDMQPLFGQLFWLMVASAALSPISTTLFATAGAHKLFALIFRVSVAKQAAVFACVIGVVTLNLGLTHYVTCELVLSLAQVVYLWRASAPVTSERGGDLLAALRTAHPWALMRTGWSSYIKAYAMPLTATSALSYVRGHVPIILLGSQFSLESAAVYSILRNMLTTIHKGIGSVIKGVFPRVFEMYESDRDRFIRRFYRYMNAAYALRVAIGGTIVAGAPVIFWVYKIDRTPLVVLVLGILVLEFLLAEIVGVSNLTVMLSKRTTMLLWSAGVRFTLEAVLIVLVTLRYGFLGAAITLFLSRSAETLVVIWASNRVIPLRRQYGVFGVVMVVFVLTLISASAF